MRSVLPLLVLAFVVLAAPTGRAGKTALLSKGADAGGVNLLYGRPSISSNGRFVAFAGNPAGLVPEDQDGNMDVFLRDRKKGKVKRISAPAGGGDADGWSHDAAISADGRFVAYTSGASNLPLGGLNPDVDVFVYDRKLGTNTLVSVKWVEVGKAKLPVGANGACFRPSLSGDGRYVAYLGHADNLAPGASSTSTNVFVHDRQLGTTVVASSNAFHQPANAPCNNAAFSKDGTRVAFTSKATNLGPATSGSHQQIFVRTLQSDVVELASRAPGGAEANALCTQPTLSADGRVVAFSSLASNLVSGDTNGAEEVYVRDFKHGITTRVAVDANGQQVPAGSFGAQLTPNGRYVVFATQGQLVKSDQDNAMDIYLHDLKKGKTKRVSIGRKQKPPNGASFDAVLDAKARFVAFRSAASNLVKGDGNGIEDVFLRRMK